MPVRGPTKFRRLFRICGRPGRQGRREIRVHQDRQRVAVPAWVPVREGDDWTWHRPTSELKPERAAHPGPAPRSTSSAVRGAATCSSDLRSESTPKKTSVRPPRIIRKEPTR